MDSFSSHVAIPMECTAAQGSSGSGEAQSAAQVPRPAPGPAAEGVERQGSDELCGLSVASAETADVYGAPAPQLISRFEHPPPQEVLEKRAGELELTRGLPCQWPDCTKTLQEALDQRASEYFATWPGPADTLLPVMQLSTSRPVPPEQPCGSRCAAAGRVGHGAFLLLLYPAWHL